jgi:hypothetical protein
MAIIEARSLVKTYTMGDQTVHALNGVSLDWICPPRASTVWAVKK